MPTPAIKPRTEPMDKQTFDMLTRCIAELLLLVAKPEGQARGSNVVPFERGARR